MMGYRVGVYAVEAARTLLAVGSALLSSMMAYSLRPEPRIDPGQPQVGGWGDFYIARRDGFYTYRPLSLFSYTTDDGERISVETDENGLRNAFGALRNAEIVVLGDSFISAIATPASETLVANLSSFTGCFAYSAAVEAFRRFRKRASCGTCLSPEFIRKPWCWRFFLAMTSAIT